MRGVRDKGLLAGHHPADVFRHTVKGPPQTSNLVRPGRPHPLLQPPTAMASVTTVRCRIGSVTCAASTRLTRLVTARITPPAVSKTHPGLAYLASEGRHGHGQLDDPFELAIFLSERRRDEQPHLLPPLVPADVLACAIQPRGRHLWMRLGHACRHRLVGTDEDAEGGIEDGDPCSHTVGVGTYQGVEGRAVDVWTGLPVFERLREHGDQDQRLHMQVVCRALEYRGLEAQPHPDNQAAESDAGQDDVRQQQARLQLTGEEWEVHGDAPGGNHSRAPSGCSVGRTDRLPLSPVTTGCARPGCAGPPPIPGPTPDRARRDASSPAPY